MGPLIALALIVGTMLVAELGRTLVARLFRYPPERVPYVKLMILPGIRGTTGFRLALILAGPVAAYLAISGVAFSHYSCHGMYDGQTNIIESTGAPSAGKLVEHDAIVEVDGTPFAGGTAELSRQVNGRQGAPIELTVERDGKRMRVAVQPKQIGEPGRNGWILGVRLAPKLDKSSARAFKNAITYPVDRTVMIGRGIVSILTENEEVGPDGPARLASELRRAADGDPNAIVMVTMVIGVYVLIVLMLVDIGRMIFLLLFRS